MLIRFVQSWNPILKKRPFAPLRVTVPSVGYIVFVVILSEAKNLSLGYMNPPSIRCYSWYTNNNYIENGETTLKKQ